MKVVLTTRARQDLRAVRAWLTQPGSGLKARRKLAAIRTALAKLSDDAKRWPVYGPSADPKLKRRSVEGHTIIYEIVELPPPAAEAAVRVQAIYAPGQYPG